MGENSGLMNPDFEESFLQIYSTDLKNLAKYVETNGFNYFGYLTSIVDKMNENPVNHAQPHKKKDGKKRSKWWGNQIATLSIIEFLHIFLYRCW